MISNQQYKCYILIIRPPNEIEFVYTKQRGRSNRTYPSSCQDKEDKVHFFKRKEEIQDKFPTK